MSLHSNIVVNKQYKSICLWKRIVRKIMANYLKKSCCFFYEDWQNRLEQYSVIIIYAYRNNFDLIKYVSSRKHDYQKVIIWYWNPVIRCIHPDKIRHLGCELWSFDPLDCQRYNLHFNTTYYFKELELPSNSMRHRSVFFCGLDKGRKEKLDEIQQKLNIMGLTSYFHVVDEKKSVAQRLPLLSYQEYLEYLSVSDAVLDVLQDGQEGMTLRVMEALFLKKKLITTQKNLLKADFYHPDNIFIIGMDNWSQIKEFMNRPIYSIPNEILIKYDFDSWIKRLIY